MRKQIVSHPKDERVAFRPLRTVLPAPSFAAVNDMFTDNARQQIVEATANFHARLAWTRLNVAHPIEGAMVLVRMADGRDVAGFYDPKRGEWWHRPGS